MAGTQYKAPRREVGYDHLAMRIELLKVRNGMELVPLLGVLKGYRALVA